MNGWHGKAEELTMKSEGVVSASGKSLTAWVDDSDDGWRDREGTVRANPIES